ncbi:MAG: 1-(5-phosphoribosyl)-5-[(5-phosphoribosylamino)methylideneamino]imidazole-4-carboxamide isomerase [Chloroflexi bacterium]|nr:MAG: 1-(5-phosphoribosyl)-5-[(5-phosphoribosylamino)methylideneamino]imidazole-4-carboxamide isomerase [Chloroflexota bacterium]
MIIYPAIDLRGGKVVRLREGDPNRQQVFSEDPIATAQQWIDEGANWIHMVNLDGAFAAANDNLRILEQVAKLGINIQFGGGLRTLEDVQRALNLGAKRVVIGTLATQSPQAVTEAIERFGAEAICVALDARDGKIATHGWQEQTDLTPIQFGREMAERGVIHALYTDIQRDGNLLGVNIHDTIALARNTGLKVIASGGVSHMDEIHKLAQSKVVAGAIIGMALYEGKLTLAEALLAAKEA